MLRGLCEEEIEVAHAASHRLRAELLHLTKSAREQDEHRVAELKQQGVEFLKLRGEAKAAEAQLETVYSAVTALEAELIKERNARSNEVELLKAVCHENLLGLPGPWVSSKGGDHVKNESAALQAQLRDSEVRANQTNEELDVAERESQSMAALLQEALLSRKGFVEQLRGGVRPCVAQTFPEAGDSTTLRVEEQELRAARLEASELRSALASIAGIGVKGASAERPSKDAAFAIGGEATGQSEAADKVVWNLEATALGLRIEVEVLTSDVSQLQIEVEDAASRIAAAKSQEDLFRAETSQIPLYKEPVPERRVVKTSPPKYRKEPPSDDANGGSYSFRPSCNDGSSLGEAAAVPSTSSLPLTTESQENLLDTSLSASASLPSSPEASAPQCRQQSLAEAAQQAYPGLPSDSLPNPAVSFGNGPVGAPHQQPHRPV